MKLLTINPKILKFNSFKSLVNQFQINEHDLIFTHRSLYNEFMKPLNLKCNVLIKNDYGNGEPSDEMINNILEDVSKINFKRLFAIGGGTVLDISKLLVLKDVRNAIDVFNNKIPIIKEKELIAIPTTCGTGSEVTNISIAEIKQSETKLGIANDELYPDFAILVPELLNLLPYKYFIHSSIDALIHAVESYVSPNSNDFTELFSTNATKIILESFIKIVENGEEFRFNLLENILIASNYAGIAFGNTGVGAVHALSYPIGGKYHVPHGEANYLFFSEVFKTYNKLNPNGKINELNKLISKILKTDNENMYDKLDELLNKLLKRFNLRHYGMLENEIEIFTDSVIEKQQRLLKNNYVPLSREDILNIYKNLY